MEAREIRYLLRAHARTFALTLAILPRSLREPLGVVYLLARASDTIADVGKISRERRVALLEQLLGNLESALSGGSPTGRWGWAPVMMPGELDESQAELIAEVPRLINALEISPDRDELLKLWRLILEGQLFDLRRFPSVEPLKREELERYCFLVAGSVGACWTRLISGHAPDRLMLPMAEMIPLGIAYGKGLQLLNILRDRDEDRSLGRIYARDEELPGLFALADEWLALGERYLAHLRPGRVLFATALPLDLAWSTLAKLKDPELHSSLRGVKLNRWEVYDLLLRGLNSLCLPRRGNPAS
ncbi:MAG: squalene/phytoene synthase family protein [Verrucomicrobia bacterium]|nr:squalene/phytoene synthase family protein [Verrucomicrobiota bacterium]